MPGPIQLLLTQNAADKVWMALSLGEMAHVPSALDLEKAAHVRCIDTQKQTVRASGSYTKASDCGTVLR
jgi:hypothetical protein